MQIVIDIDENVYARLFDNGEVSLTDMLTACVAIRKGTPLPAKHGRLIDANEFEKRLMNARSYYLGEKADGFDLRFAAGLKSAVERLVDAQTVIPADKEESE
jgi:hypothetical protein